MRPPLGLSTNLLLGFKSGAILHPSRRSQHCEKIFIWSAPNRYAIRTSIAEIAQFVAYLCNTSPYPDPL